MKNTNTKAFKDNLKNYLLPIIEEKAGGYGEKIEGNPYMWLVNLAKSEVKHEFDRGGDQKGLEYWLSGLGMNIDYLNCGIINTSEKIHECKLTEKQKEMVIEKWFSFLAAKILQFSVK